MYVWMYVPHAHTTPLIQQLSSALQNFPPTLITSIPRRGRLEELLRDPGDSESLSLSLSLRIMSLQR